jgi:putative ABC transport system permease protein
MTEGLLLAAIGGAIGVAVSYPASSLIAHLSPEGLPRAQSAHIDAGVLLVALVLIIGVGMISSTAPVWRVRQTDLGIALKSATRDGRSRRSLGQAFTVAEVALAFVLTIGAGLMARTFWHLTVAGAGFDAHNVLTLTTTAVGKRYAGNLTGYYNDVLKELRTINGIESAAMASLIPMDYTERSALSFVEHPISGDREMPYADEYSVSTDYFTVMRIPLKRGRVFTEHDDAAAPAVAMINETLARTWFRNDNPIGKHIKLGGSSWMTIIGIAGDVRQDGMDRPVDPQVYMPLNQRPIIYYYRLVARTRGDPMLLERAVRSVFSEVDPGSPVYHLRPLEAWYAERLADRTFAMTLLSLLSFVALLLSAVGIYGVISHLVATRTKEIGIRMALGATARHVFRFVVKHAVPSIAMGLGIGLGLSLLLSRLLASLLFQVGATDPATFVAVAMLLGILAISAAALPGLRATRLQPLRAIRDE